MYEWRVIRIKILHIVLDTIASKIQNLFMKKLEFTRNF